MRKDHKTNNITEETKSYLCGECAVLLQQLVNPFLFLTVV